MPDMSKGDRKSPYELFDSDKVVGFLLAGGYEVEVVPHTYKEYLVSGPEQEIFVARDANRTKQAIIGPTSNIIAIWVAVD